jgi:hypothetical protein
MKWMVCGIGEVSDQGVRQTGMEDGKDVGRRS